MGCNGNFDYFPGMKFGAVQKDEEVRLKQDKCWKHRMAKYPAAGAEHSWIQLLALLPWQVSPCLHE